MDAETAAQLEAEAAEDAMMQMDGIEEEVTAH